GQAATQDAVALADGPSAGPGGPRVGAARPPIPKLGQRVTGARPRPFSPLGSFGFLGPSRSNARRSPAPYDVAGHSAVRSAGTPSEVPSRATRWTNPPASRFFGATRLSSWASAWMRWPPKHRLG